MPRRQQDLKPEPRLLEARTRKPLLLCKRIRHGTQASSFTAFQEEDVVLLL
jgi:hypothetical protein